MMTYQILHRVLEALACAKQSGAQINRWLVIDLGEDKNDGARINSTTNDSMDIN